MASRAEFFSSSYLGWDELDSGVFVISTIAAQVHMNEQEGSPPDYLYYVPPPPSPYAKWNSCGTGWLGSKYNGNFYIVSVAHLLYHLPLNERTPVEVRRSHRFLVTCCHDISGEAQVIDWDDGSDVFVLRVHLQCSERHDLPRVCFLHPKKKDEVASIGHPCIEESCKPIKYSFCKGIVSQPYVPGSLLYWTCWQGRDCDAFMTKFQAYEGSSGSPVYTTDGSIRGMVIGFGEFFGLALHMRSVGLALLGMEGDGMSGFWLGILKDSVTMGHGWHHMIRNHGDRAGFAKFKRCHGISGELQCKVRRR